MPETEKKEMAHGAPAFYRDKEGKIHYVSKEIGDKEVAKKNWIEISKEEAISNSREDHSETAGKPKDT